MTLLKDILIPLTAIITSTWLALATIRNQRRSAADQRYWETRSTLYVEILANQDGYFTFNGDFDPRATGEEQPSPNTPEEWNLHRTLRARVDAFASEEVRRLWLASAQADAAVGRWAQENVPELAGERYPTLDDARSVEVAPLIAARDAAQLSLRQQIRRELGAAVRSR